jgi:hypothetical protein
VGLIFHTWWIWLGFFLTLLPAGVYMLHYMFENRKWRSRIRFMWMMRNPESDAKLLKTKRKEIVDMMDRVTA